MNILMISPIVPWPPNMGSKIRIYHVLKELSRYHKVTLIALAQEDDPKSINVLRSICSAIHTLPVGKRSRWFTAFLSIFSLKPYRVVKFYQPQLKEIIKEILNTEHYDMVWIHFLNMCSYIPLNVLKFYTIILDQHNADELWWIRFAQNGPWWQRTFAKQNLWKERRFQRKILETVDAILSVSDEEATLMRTRATPSCRVWVVPNGIDSVFLQNSTQVKKKEKRKNIIIFCGSLNVSMNIDAVEKFVIKIFPHIKLAIPDSEFWVVGRNPIFRIIQLGQHDGVKIIGNVLDVSPYYERARIAVAPFQYGAGTKLKVLEAMAMGVPLVSTRIGAFGIQAISGKHIIIEDDRMKFAQSVIVLLQNDRLHRSIATQAKELVEKNYTWEKIMRDILDKVNGLAEKKLSNFSKI
jgi:sugar transferase (PEP-CTERM/EpsH1 system associated)